MFVFAVIAALASAPVPASLDRAAPTPQVVSTTPQPVLSSVAVTVECTAFKDGRVGGCAVLGETHPGLGFGDAAIALMQSEQLQPSAHDVQFARTIQFMP